MAIAAKVQILGGRYGTPGTSTGGVQFRLLEGDNTTPFGASVVASTAVLSAGSFTLMSGFSDTPHVHVFSFTSPYEIVGGKKYFIETNAGTFNYLGDEMIHLEGIGSGYVRVNGGSWSPDTTIGAILLDSSDEVIASLNYGDAEVASFAGNFDGDSFDRATTRYESPAVELPPTDPTPAHEAEDVNLPISQLAWECEGEPDEYKVYFGTELEGREYLATTTDKFYNLDDQFIDPGLTYVWKVVAVYGENEVESDDWTFDTEAIGVALGVPYSPTPSDTATDVPLSTELLEWECYTPDGQFGGAVTYDVYFNGDKIGNTNVKNIAMPRHVLAYNTTYSWYVVVRNSASSNTGPTWTFTTAALATSPLPAGDNFGTRVKRLVAAADDKIWIEDI